MARSRTTKTIAKRIDLTYYKRSHPLRRWRRVLTWTSGAIALVWLSIASTRWTGHSLVLNDHIHNPAPVSAAHAMFQDDCAQCHAPKPGGGFIMAVTDQACLKCHDGAIHQENQKIAAEPALVSRTHQLLALKEADHPGGARSAACATCHVEHRGHEMLAATSDAHCLVCHENLNSATRDGHATVANRIVAFNATDHPAFGNQLRDSAGKWVDPTVLRFNHQVHLNDPKFKDKPDSCVICHVPNPADRRYMLPISFAKDCKSCHELRPTPESAPVAHEAMPIVRAQLMSASLLYETSIREMPRDQRDAQLSRQIRRGLRTTTETITEQQWITDHTASLNKTVLEWLDSPEAKKISRYDDIKIASTQPADLNPTGAVWAAEAYVAYGMSNSCFKCHDLKSDQTTGEFSTLPTSIGTQPRRWFAASVFNHDSHRNEACRDCHEAAWTSTATSDLLLPDINKAASGAASCVECHHADLSSQVRGAPASCVTCHTFHDRSLDQPANVARK